MRKRNNLGLLAAFVLLISPMMAWADDDNGGNSNWLQKLGNSVGNNSSDNSGDNSATSVAGVRGLEETNGKVDTNARDYAAIDRLDKVQISDAELNAFIKEGAFK